MDFEKLYAVYYMQVYSYVMTLAKNQSTAEEITQNAFVKAMLKEHTYRQGASELTWLCAIAKNLYMDELRKQKKLVPMEQCEEPARNSDIEVNLENSDSAYNIHCILHTLEEPYKEVFHLRVFGELPFKTIGSIFGKTENWARVTYHRARLKIQERIDKE